MNPLLRSFAAAALALSLLAPAYAAEPAHWVGTWTASPQATWDAGFVLPNNAPDRLRDQTVRQVARISVGGTRVRIALSNAYGREPVVIGAARVARSLGGSRIDAGSDRALTFGGRAEVTLLPGAPVLSDPVELSAPALAELAVSLYLPQDTALRSFHWEGGQDAYLARGDRSAQAALDGADTVSSRPYLSGIYVESARPLRTVVAFGDSITDGAASSINRNHRWPDFLAQRLASRDIAVLNAGISGAQVLNDGMGVNALARFERDVLAQRPDSVVLLMGINDIGWPGSSFEPAREAMSAQRLIGGYRQLIARARQAGVRIIGATLTPFEHALPDAPVKRYFNPQKERVRQQVNAWIRDSGEFDAVADFDALLRDPAHPASMQAAFDSGDRLHPGDAGYRAMADSLDETVLFGAH
ncbi:lipolytic enzyme, G-D-S-L family [Lysobacter enzymogenes]|uniref:Lipolytic enzyme, G-D-S-L family n=1 Tax=Lysobacter enzymogenes TaxID=69 RepID=A0A0S2DDQ3_LYSEN|nr:SGNH/GDSL hydrolase family protein [Lysobacter enzymogenes]ALN56660.1 lipolytic enzyme, G-D-S-L family [Lysobacter enzymogenes]QCW25450.1 SGNH/GDSL hydrolase family protein [Lysobacter enzymogenes]